jgi:hypothetical protein
LSLAAAVIAALGPAEKERATYLWPPARLPVEQPRAGWYAPLPLLNRVPARVLVRVPCDLSPPLARTSASATVIATARRPRDVGGLRLELRDASLLVGVGGRVTTLPWPDSCPLQVTVERGRLVAGKRVLRLATSTPGHMPIVTGIFSQLDLRSRRRPEFDLTTRAYATSPTARQFAAILIASLSAFAAILLAVGVSAKGWSSRLVRRMSAGLRALEVVDAIVVGTLLLLWVLGPIYHDDGWIRARQGAYGALGAFTNYYDNWGVDLPLLYWVEWLQHWVVASTTQIVLMRLPSLAVLIALWFVIKWCAIRSADGLRNSRLAGWLLAGAFVVGAAGWGMTLRPEPLVALLVAVSLSAMLAFVRAPGIGPLVVAGLAVVLAVNAHPAGGTAAAPIIAAAPTVYVWLRRTSQVWIAVAALAVAGLALGLLLLTIDADLGTRLADARLVRAGALHAEPWWREYERYWSVIRDGGNQVRRLSLLLLVAAVGLFLTRARTHRSRFSSLPGHALCVALVLLVLTPSKWMWHFGTLISLVSVALVVEILRMASSEESNVRRAHRPAVLLLLFGGAGLWAWGAPSGWAALDLGTAEWNDGFNLLPWVVGVPVALAAIAFIRRRRASTWATMRRELALITGASIAAFSLVVVWITLAVFGGDAAFARWSPARQNVSALVGRSGCGVADTLTVPASEGHSLTRLVSRPATTLVDPFIAPYFPCIDQPTIRDGVVTIPAHLVAQGTPWPVLARDGPFAALHDLYPIRQVLIKRGVRVWEIDRRITGYVRADAVRVAARARAQR